jgi:hypothetical protein
MKIFPLLIAILLIPVATLAGDLDKFLKEFEKAASKMDKKALKAMIYPLKAGDEDVQESMIKAVLANDPGSTGDLAFSIDALSRIRSEYSDEFQEVPDILFEQFKSNPDMGKVVSKLKQKDVLIFEHNNARMILVKEKKEWQFLFWEDLNSVL